MLLILDGNNLAWAGFHALGRAMGAETPAQKTRAALVGLTQGALGMVIRRGEPPDRPGLGALSGVAIAFDHGRPLRRRSIFPAYQTGRERTAAFVDNEQFVLEAIDRFIAGAAMLPVEILRGENTEADDLVAARMAVAGTDPVRICSTDRDFLQLVGESLSIYSPVKRLVIDTANFTEAAAPRDTAGTPIAFPRERYLEYRVASGDASDDLPGIPGVGTTTAARFVAYAPLAAYLDEPALAARVLGRRSRRVEDAFASGEARAAVERNRELMDLRLAAARYPGLDGYASHGELDERGFHAWLEEERISAIDLGALYRALAREPARLL